MLQFVFYYLCRDGDEFPSVVNRQAGRQVKSAPKCFHHKCKKKKNVRLHYSVLQSRPDFKDFCVIKDQLSTSLFIVPWCPFFLKWVTHRFIHSYRSILMNLFMLPTVDWHSEGHRIFAFFASSSCFHANVICVLGITQTVQKYASQVDQSL